MAEKRKFTITYVRTLTRCETLEAISLQEAKRMAEKRAWESCELTNSDFDESDTQFEVSPQEECEGCEQELPQIEERTPPIVVGRVPESLIGAEF